MKYVLLAIGVAVGLTIAWSPRYLAAYSQRGLPPQPYMGPKFRYWKNGVEIT